MFRRNKPRPLSRLSFDIPPSSRDIAFEKAKRHLQTRHACVVVMSCVSEAMHECKSALPAGWPKKNPQKNRKRTLFQKVSGIGKKNRKL